MLLQIQELKSSVVPPGKALGCEIQTIWQRERQQREVYSFFLSKLQLHQQPCRRCLHTCLSVRRLLHKAALRVAADSPLKYEWSHERHKHKGLDDRK